MNRPKFNRFTTAVICFVLGIVLAAFGQTFLANIFKGHPRAQGAESVRVTSPDGRLDAVLIEDSSGGALGGVFWCLYVVPKDKAVPSDTTKQVFFADELTKVSVVWGNAHLIEIHYDKASIMHFRNISTREETELEYVELRLVPASEYSLITPEGGWRPDN